MALIFWLTNAIKVIGIAKTKSIITSPASALGAVIRPAPDPVLVTLFDFGIFPIVLVFSRY
jgi:hypothetical protein